MFHIFHRIVALLFIAAFTSGCAGYAGTVKEMRIALAAGDQQRALAEINKELGVKDPDAFPEKLKGDNALLVLERATIKQALEQFTSSVKDFMAADKNMELLDLKNDVAGNIGKWLFSGDSGVYKAPPHEKLLLNTLNMLNFLADGRLEEARVEARRLTVMQDYLSDEEGEKDAMLGLGSYFAGFTFEMSRRSEQALRYYAEALDAASYPSLNSPIKRLAACNHYRTERLESVIGEVDASQVAVCEEKPPGKATILVVPMAGLAPHKEAVRMPIGAAVVLAGHFLTDAQSSQSSAFVTKGLLTFVNYPEMKATASRYKKVTVSVDGKVVPIELALDVTSAVLASWESFKPKIVAAAVVRAIARLVAGTATEKAVEAASDNALVGLLSGLLVQGTMTAMDTPDTRSWVTLPSKVLIARVEVSPGKHEIKIIFEGPTGQKATKKTIEMVEGGFAVIPVASMR